MSSHLEHANIYMVGFVKLTLDFQIRSLKLRSYFLDIFEGNWAWEVRARMKGENRPLLTNEPTQFEK